MSVIADDRRFIPFIATLQRSLPISSAVQVGDADASKLDRLAAIGPFEKRLSQLSAIQSVSDAGGVVKARGPGKISRVREQGG